jgi:hypothetical protein
MAAFEAFLARSGAAFLPVLGGLDAAPRRRG